jgi:hypothetical protein
MLKDDSALIQPIRPNRQLFLVVTIGEDTRRAEVKPKAIDWPKAAIFIFPVRH